MEKAITSTKSELDSFLAARDLLLKYRSEYEQACQRFRWSALRYFNWALDYFDHFARNNSNTALWIVNENGSECRITFEEMSLRSAQAAALLLGHGVQRGTRILLMLPNTAALWEIMLAALKIGAVLVPTSTLLVPEELRERVVRSDVTHVITDLEGSSRFAGFHDAYMKLMVGGGAKAGWIDYEQAYAERPAELSMEPAIPVDDLYLLYFTSGTTSHPKLVAHNRQSYPVGHLATMYWMGLQPGDLHMNISSPGWGKHAWSSLFAPWNAGATVFVHNGGRFDPTKTLGAISRYGVTTLCAPPVVWRMLVQQPLESYPVVLREAVSAGEPLNPEIIRKVKTAWGVTIRDGYGQTETVALLGNFPGQRVKPGSVGRPTPGHKVVILDPSGCEADEGEICLSLNPKPLSLMTGYVGSESNSEKSSSGDYHPMGDIAQKDEDGYFTYIGRADDVFKCSGYRISPFELESVLVECPVVAEAAVVPSPDAKRGAVPKAFLSLSAGSDPSRASAYEIFRFTRSRLGAFKRVRRIEFRELPKTGSGKIRRVELRNEESGRAETSRLPYEFWEEDFPELQSKPDDKTQR